MRRADQFTDPKDGDARCRPGDRGRRRRRRERCPCGERAPKGRSPPKNPSPPAQKYPSDQVKSQTRFPCTDKGPMNGRDFMKLVAFSVENYRSITTARKIPLSGYSLLVGANNEGKSNILHALALGMDALSNWVQLARRMPDGRIVRSSRSLLGEQITNSRYDWKTDFPINKQGKSGATRVTKITFEFQFDEKEVDAFKAEIKSNLNGTIPILISFGHDSTDLSVQKPGRGHATLNKKSSKIAEFVSSRIRFEYIPAIRTADSATRIISQLVERELRRIESNPEYIAALDKIEMLQKPIFDKLASTIQTTVSSFLPSVKSVSLVPQREARSRALRREVEVMVDDGSLTKLSRKGDGVQSLAALALMRHISEQHSEGISTIIAIEEPESHLHSRAIHELRTVIEELSRSNQIVLTSHSPLFVKINNLKNTVIVQNSKAKCAEHVSEVREALGVRFSDNLQNASLVLLVEGSDDIASLRAILVEKSPTIKKALAGGVITFDDLGGASSLSQKASFYQSSACQVQCFLDNDASGKLAVDKAIASRSLSISDINLCVVPGQDESELEDLYDVNVYQQAFLKEFGVDPKLRPVGKKGRKWSDVMERIFKESGKPWSPQIKASVKNWMAQYSSDNGNTIIRKETEKSLLAFIASVEGKLPEL